MDVMIFHVVDDSLGVCISYRSLKLTRTPEMSSRIPQPELRLPFEQLMCRCSLQHMERLRNARGRRNLHDEMEVVGHHRHLNDPNTMAVSYLAKNGFTKIFMLLLVKHFVPVLGAPLQMVHTLANTMAPAIQLHFFYVLDRYFIACYCGRACPDNNTISVVKRVVDPMRAIHPLSKGRGFLAQKRLNFPHLTSPPLETVCIINGYRTF